MGRKIFVSYKYRDNNVYPLNYNYGTTVRSYVDKLEEYFDSTDNIYKGESDNEDLSQLSENAIWERLKNRIFDSTITIVMISPDMKEPGRYDKSQWIPWEISYSLKEMIRNDRTSRSNAILAIVLPDRNNSYEYFLQLNRCNNCSCTTYLTNTLFGILSNNMFNQKEKIRFNCETGNHGNIYTGEYSYIKTVKWEDFANYPNAQINAAVAIKENIDDYNVVKEV
ncbi:TIR domain-containing protein [Draconibacterium sp. IB214405]|uniref:TIR domain-containing protein n=1 Tax=Draconibacterium sp. IB214405 TaxID=3097352 RepID=UPI002A1570C0|nr:TIR domain-containing protein [Draconibacterium sp. IB214405]MDX8338830.1 TIR domain-containing protein [Draconibacterium sp. IB214405]